MNMRIGIEARMMGAENTRGLGRYVEELVKAMANVAPDNEYVLVTRSAKHALAGLPQVKTVVADIPWYGLEEQLKLPAILRGLKTDVVHVPHWNVPLRYSGPLVVTIHDLLLLHQPNSANASTRAWPIRLAKRLGFKMTLRHAVNSAKRICVPTEFVKNDLLGYFPTASGKVLVTGEGVSRFVASSHARLPDGQVPTSQAPGTCDVRRATKTVLYIGSAYPHKRLDLLLEAWQAFASKHEGYELVIAGEMDAFMSRIKNQAQNMGLSRATFLGRVPDDRMAELFAGASFFVWPSSFEGFGLSPVEALSVGCPVVSSDAQPMPEVLGKNGVVYFKSGSVDGMIRAMNEVVDNLGLYRDKAKDSIADLLARHDWAAAAKRTLAAYQQALG